MTWRPQKGLNSWQQVWKWRKGYSPPGLIFAFLNRIPQMTYPAGEKAYWTSVDDDGLHNPIARHNIWRQPWHFLAAWITMFLGCQIFEWEALLFGALTILWGALEFSNIKDDIHDDATNGVHLIAKSCCDLIFRLAGTYLGLEVYRIQELLWP